MMKSTTAIFRKDVVVIMIRGMRPRPTPEKMTASRLGSNLSMAEQLPDPDPRGVADADQLPLADALAIGHDVDRPGRVAAQLEDMADTEAAQRAQGQLGPPAFEDQPHRQL